MDCFLRCYAEKIPMIASIKTIIQTNYINLI